MTNYFTYISNNEANKENGIPLLSHNKKEVYLPLKQKFQHY